MIGFSERIGRPAKVNPAIEWMSSALKPDGVLVFGIAFANEKALPPEHSDESILDLAETAAALRAGNVEVTALIGDEWDGFRSRQ